MIPSNSPWRPAEAAELTWDENGTPCSSRFDDIYYSAENGLEESRYVFLDGNDLPARWKHHDVATFCIAETGFGTGLNFLATWDAWRKQPGPKPCLHYVAAERYPLSPDDLRRALLRWPELETLAQDLLAAYPGLVPGEHRCLFDDGQVRLDLWWHDATDTLGNLPMHEDARVDAWYLDGFAPSRDSSLWEESLFRVLSATSKPGATFATFTAAGHVRRALAAAGFEVRKREGFGRKRECAHGKLLPRVQSGTAGGGSLAVTPWDLPGNTTETPEHVIVLGAGLAGATSAAALAQRGLAVTLIDQGAIAGGASANAQGVLYTRLSTRHSDLVDFALQSYVFATRFYRDLFASGKLAAGSDGALCGSFAQIDDPQERETLAQLLMAVPELAQVVCADTANQHLGVTQARAGYWYPLSGWLNPPAVCRALVAHPGILVRENVGKTSLRMGPEGWQVCAEETVIATADCVILATGTSTNRFDDLHWLPLQAVRGQTTQLPATGDSSALQAVLCHKGYIAPASNGNHCIGASFGPGDTDLTPRAAEHRDNLAQLARAVPGWSTWLAGQDPDSLSGTVRLRCASNDYLPVIGRVPDRAAFIERYAALRRDARRVIASPGEYLPGLFVTAAHGSRGLTSAALGGELLASMICNEPPPVSRKLGRALSPARFIIRDLMRNRI